MNNEHAQQAFNVLAEIPLKNLDVNWRDQRPQLTPDNDLKPYAVTLTPNIRPSCGPSLTFSPQDRCSSEPHRRPNCKVAEGAVLVSRKETALSCYGLWSRTNRFFCVQLANERPKTLEDRPGRWMPCLLSRSMKWKLLARHVLVLLS